MRFLVRLSVEKGRKEFSCLPVNYQYELSAWIYKTVNKGNNVFSEWLHSHGYSSGSKSFKLFVFSNLLVPKFSIENQYLNILSNEVSFGISFLLDETAEPFIYGMFKQREFSLGDHTHQTNFAVQSIERLPDPDFEKITRFRTISPMVIGSITEENHNHATYLNPQHKLFSEIFFSNLINKFVALSHYSKQSNVSCTEAKLKLQTDTNFRSKLITIKANTPQQTKVKGYLFQFSMEAPVQLKKIAYHAGCGEKNSLGFGCIEVVK